MKVFFGASQRGKKLFGRYYKQIFYEIGKLGYEIIKDDLYLLSQKEFYKKLDLKNPKTNKEFYKNKISSLQKADINIFDCSFHSLSIGFIVNKSLELNKPTVLLYYKDNEPFFLEGAVTNQDKLIIKSYTDNNLPKIIKTALNLAREKKDKRFNFFISPKVMTYIKQHSKELGMSESTYVRSLIIEDMRKAG